MGGWTLDDLRALTNDELEAMFTLIKEKKIQVTVF